MKRCLIVFAKEPQANKVKTRLKGILSGSQRVDLYKAFLKDTVEIARGVDCEEKIMAYESNGKVPLYLKTIARDFQFHEQKGKNLGNRMHNAFKFAVRKGAQEAVIIGSDSPTLPLSYINDAFGRLKTVDVVLGPTLDGGYYLIGVKKPCLNLFKNIRWSTKTVFEDTLRNAKKSKKRVSILDYWYDVDDRAGLARLKSGLKIDKNQHTAKYTGGVKNLKGRKDMDFICPICNKTLPREILVIVPHSEEHIVEAIKKKHPGWVTPDGLCAKCYQYYKEQMGKKM